MTKKRVEWILCIYLNIGNKKDKQTKKFVEDGEKEDIRNAMVNTANKKFGKAADDLTLKLIQNSTKIQQLPLSKDGIPGTNGVEIGVYVSRDSRLVAAKNGSLYTITPNGDNATFTTFTTSIPSCIGYTITISICFTRSAIGQGSGWTSSTCIRI